MNCKRFWLNADYADNLARSGERTAKSVRSSLVSRTRIGPWQSSATATEETVTREVNKISDDSVEYGSYGFTLQMSVSLRSEPSVH